MRTVLKVKDITKIYAQGQKPSLSNVSFDVAKGEFIGIMEASRLWKNNPTQCTLQPLIKQQVEKCISMM